MLDQSKAFFFNKHSELTAVKSRLSISRVPLILKGIRVATPPETR